MIDPDKTYDVLIAGGGNAALCAAIRAAEGGARVLVCEAAPKGFRGGNSRHTRNLRTAHDAPTDVLTESYSDEEYFEDLMRVTAGKTNETLARLAIGESKHVAAWMAGQGVRFQKSLGGTLSLSRTNPFFLGGGKALLNAYYLRAAELGVDILYDTAVTGLEIHDGFFTGAALRSRGFEARIGARALIAAAGGFQANKAWLEEAWGPAARNFKIRGTPYATGSLLRLMLEAGMDPVGEADQCHAVAIDARAPDFDGGIATRLDCVPFSIVVNREGERFYDEGEDFWPKRYAIWGRLVAKQPGQIGFSILDAQSISQFMPSIFPPERADTIEELATRLSLDPVRLRRTVDAFNAACDAGRYDPAVHDGLRTTGLVPDKTNWARPIVEPPFFGYPLRPGITFTYLGVRVDEGARVAMAGGKPAANIWAAGEIMAGNILGQGYLAGIGMTIGTVFGRIAGERAAAYVRN
ncbi:FAD-dependent tricarballylate dehydrogenase TcuA [Rhodobacteraceae bacterium NNCM2]|nr:FAD-dependent tricarballylate dehydrogenase TcuA [Coraliihabitans acroporae]